jgi:outer membrane protein OmpA-like peptidoglycan-associated protein
MKAHTLGSLTPSLITLAVLVAGGCVITPETDALNEVRTTYAQAANDPQVVDHAPFALREAADSLRQTKRLVVGDAEEAEIVHQAYLTRERVAIARELAEQGAAEEEIRQAEAERQQILLEARTAEVKQAQALAAERAQEAAMARQKAQRAQERAQELATRAEELSRRVDDLKAQETERGLVVTLGDLLFDSGEAKLKAGGVRAIDKLALFLKEYPERNILIEGYTDSTGAEEFNQQLSEKRANAVRDALLADAIDLSRMRAIGYGEQFPVASNATAHGRQQNRRVEVIISDQKGDIPGRT